MIPGMRDEINTHLSSIKEEQIALKSTLKEKAEEIKRSKPVEPSDRAKASTKAKPKVKEEKKEKKGRGTRRKPSDDEESKASSSNDGDEDDVAVKKGAGGKKKKKDEPPAATSADNGDKKKPTRRIPKFPDVTADGNGNDGDDMTLGELKVASSTANDKSVDKEKETT